MTFAGRPSNSDVGLPRLLTVKQVAEILQTSTRTVRRLISDSQLDVVYIGRLVRVPAAALEALLNRGTGERSN